MYQDIRLFLNETDITDQVIFRQRDLDIRQKFRNYTASIGLVIPSTSTISIYPSNEVKVKYTNTNNETRTLFGGIIFGTEYGEMASDGSIELMLDCEGFYPSLAERRTITNVLTQELNPPLNVTEADWMYYAGYLAASYVDKFLSQDGVSVGHVEAGRLLAATELEEFITMSIKDIYDTLAEPSGHSWWIDNDKVFHFGALLDFVTYSSPEDTISIGNDKFTVKGCNVELSGFTNKVFIEGSDDWDSDVPEEHLDINGRILYIKENLESITKMSAMNNNTGVFGKVLRDANIKNLQTAQYRADKVLSLYPDIPYNLRVDTFVDKFKPGDKVPVNLPFYKINNEEFTVHNVNIEMASGNKPIFHLTLSNVPELGGMENLYQFFDGLNSSVNKPNKENPYVEFDPGNPSEIPENIRQGLLVRFDPDIEGSVVEEDGIVKLNDIDGNYIGYGRDSSDGRHGIKKVNIKGRNFLNLTHSSHYSQKSFGGINLNEDHTIRTAFIVATFRDGNSQDPSRTAVPFPLGEPFRGGSSTNWALYSNDPYTLYVDDSKDKIKERKEIAVLAVCLEPGKSPYIISKIGDTGGGSTSWDIISAFSGYIGEFLLFDNRLRDTEIKAINKYLLNKYKYNLYNYDPTEPDPSVKDDEPIILSLSGPDPIVVEVGDSVTMPSTVMAFMSEGPNIVLPVTWNPATIDTSTTGEIEAVGIVEGYNGSVVFIVSVVSPGNLDTVKTEANNVNPEEYTPESYQALEDALQLPEYTQEQVDIKAIAIQNAMDGLVLDIYTAQDSDFEWETQIISIEKSYTAIGEVGNGYYRYIGTQEKVIIPNTIKGNPMTNYLGMFVGKSVTKVASFNPNIVNMERMFTNHTTSTLDISDLDTSNVTNMESMFSSIFEMNSIIGLDKFDTSNVINMKGMFNNCRAPILDLSSFNTSNVINMESMFKSTHSTIIDLSSFNTSNVTNMKYMFEYCRAPILDLSSFDTSNVTDMGYMFGSAYSTTGYAMTQADADRFNTTGRKPAGLTFIVKQ